MSNSSGVKVNAPSYAPITLTTWVAGVAELTQPDEIYWCDGSVEERDYLIEEMVASGTLLALNEDLRPGCYLARTGPSDAADVPDRTFVCTERPEDAGPTNHWANPDAMKQVLADKFNGAMRGRRMYVIPYSLGPVGGPMSKLGIEITDSPYVVVTMYTLTRIGNPALNAIAMGGFWVPGVHSVGYPLRSADGVTRPDVPWPCNPDKYIAHFPGTCEIWSYGSGLGDSAVLGRKCFALRLASVLGHEAQWYAEHMLLAKLTSPEGEVSYVAGAFPSGNAANLATLQPALPGWTSEVIGNDVAWLRADRDGQLRAINPGAGFCGSVGGLSGESSPAMLRALERDAIFTNVALTDDGDVWWEGLTDEPPAHLVDWRGDDWTPQSGRPAAHPGAGYVVGAKRMPALAKEHDDPVGVPVSVIAFGGCRASVMPLIAEAYSWEHGVFLGATLASEETGPDGATDVQRDPFAMRSYCGYNLADYWTHWLHLGRTLGAKAPHVVAVNWFRRTADGTLAWPGGGDNWRPIEWALRRVAHQAGATTGICGRVPSADDLNADGLDLTDEQLDSLLDLDPAECAVEADAIERYFGSFGNKLPAELTLELADLRGRIAAKAAS